jgi:hypothetical protein
MKVLRAHSIYIATCRDTKNTVNRSMLTRKDSREAQKFDDELHNLAYNRAPISSALTRSPSLDLCGFDVCAKLMGIMSLL